MTVVTGATTVTAWLSGQPADKACVADLVASPILATVSGFAGLADAQRR